MIWAAGLVAHCNYLLKKLYNKLTIKYSDYYIILVILMVCKII